MSCKKQAGWHWKMESSSSNPNLFLLCSTPISPVTAAHPARFHVQSNSQIPFLPPAASAPVQATIFSLLEYCSGLGPSLSTIVLAPPTLIQDQSGLNNHCRKPPVAPLWPQDKAWKEKSWWLDRWLPFQSLLPSQFSCLRTWGSLCVWISLITSHMCSAAPHRARSIQPDHLHPSTPRLPQDPFLRSRLRLGGGEPSPTCPLRGVPSLCTPHHSTDHDGHKLLAHLSPPLDWELWDETQRGPVGLPGLEALFPAVSYRQDSSLHILPWLPKSRFE